MEQPVLGELDSTLFSLLSASSDKTYFYMTDFHTNITRWSKSAVKYFGLSGEYITDIDKEWISKIHPDHINAYRAHLQAMMDGTIDYHNIEYQIRNAEGVYVWVNCKGRISLDANGNPEYFAGYVSNLGRRNKIDPITNLFTMFEFRSDIDRHLSNGASGAILLISIKSFKRINDQYGYRFGDATLFALAQKFLSDFKNRAKIYRMDGADFSFIIENGNKKDVEDLHRYLVRSLANLAVNDRILHLDFHASATVYPYDGDTVDQLQNNLYYALDFAKKENWTDPVFYVEKFYLAQTMHLRMTEALKESVAHNFEGFYFMLQPIIDGEDGTCVSAEALMRWSHPDFPKVGPMDFIPILEETGLIIPVGKWLIDACAKALATHADLPFKININLSYRQLQDPSLKSFIIETIQKYDLPAERLTLELTESCHVDDTTELAKILQSLKDEGFSIALDDFGTGYASLTVLKDIPADIVKLDHTMTRTITNKPKDRSLVEFICGFCHKTDIQVCAEGVENEEILSIVKNAGANQIQGYYYDRPLPLEKFCNRFHSSKIYPIAAR